MFDLEQRHRDTVFALLARHVPEYRAYVFGSRVQGRAKKFSDLDVALVGPAPVPAQHMDALRAELSLSSLPIFVDVVDLQAAPGPWRERIEKEMVPL